MRAVDSTQEPWQLTQEALDELGETPKEIAAKLAELGITGKLMDSDMCPLANHLLRKCGFEVSVDGDSVNLDICDLPSTVIVLSKAQSDFVINFDRGDYPLLIEPEDEGEVEEELETVDEVLLVADR